jgi:two-component system nitrogen regulation response regulator NtrX
MKILIADDNPDFASTLADIVSTYDYEPEIFNTPHDAMEYMDQNHRDISIALLDIEFGPNEELDGLDILENFRRNHPFVPVIMITGKGTIETAVRATKLGAVNFVEKSTVTKEKIKAVLESAIGNSNKSEDEDILRFLKINGLIGSSRTMLEIGDSIIRFGRTDLNILITGETGTGKKLIARALHSVSRRSKYPFVTVDIPNIPRELFQSELFGHIKGAFSGASETKKGLFHEANKGSIFLDEIGELSLDLQSNLFIPIEEKVVRRVGSVKGEDVDIRFISATDKDLVQSMNESKFREQLYHRLRECEIHVLPLRDRREDINDLIEYYTNKHNKDFDEAKHFSPASIDYMNNYNWPGNIRELSSTVRVALQTSQGERVEVTELDKIINSGKKTQHTETNNNYISSSRTLKEDLEQVDKKKIETILQNNNGNVSKSAAILGISRETLHNKIRKYDINVQEFRKKARK